MHLHTDVRTKWIMFHYIMKHFATVEGFPTEKPRVAQQNMHAQTYIQIPKCYNQQLCHGSFTNNCQQSQEHFYVEEYLPYTDSSFFTSDTWLTSFSY